MAECYVLRCTNAAVRPMTLPAGDGPSGMWEVAVCDDHGAAIATGGEWVLQHQRPDGGWQGPALVMGEDLKSIDEWVVMPGAVRLAQGDEGFASSPTGYAWRVRVPARRRGRDEVEEITLVLPEGNINGQEDVEALSRILLIETPVP